MMTALSILAQLVVMIFVLFWLDMRSAFDLIPTIVLLWLVSSVVPLLL